MMRPKWPNQIVNDKGSNMFERFDIVEIPWAQPKTHTAGGPCEWAEDDHAETSAPLAIALVSKEFGAGKLRTIYIYIIIYIYT